MTKIGIERLRTGYRQEHRTHSDQPYFAMTKHELYGISRIKGSEHAEIILDMDSTTHRHGHKPQQRNRPKELRYFCSSPALRHKQQNQYARSNRQHHILKGGSHQLQTLYSGK